MKQVWITRAGPPEVLRYDTAPDPIPGNGEVRIRVQTIGVNFADILGRIGIYPDAPRHPYVPGYEVAGTIDAVGQGVPDLNEGDSVVALTRFGGYSDVVCVSYKTVFKRPAWLDAQDAAALPVNYLTAYATLVIMGALRPGNRVLIHAAAGGVGLAALDICNIIGAETFGTASASKHDFLRERGLKHPIDYHERDYELAIRELTKNQGVDIVLDSLGGIHWRKSYRLLRPTGRAIHFGASTLAPRKRRAPMTMLRSILNSPFYFPLQLINTNKAVMGFNLLHLWQETNMIREWMNSILEWYDDALFRPHINSQFALSDAAQAHHYIQDHKNIGKVLLLTSESRSGESRTER